jgi:hypothetical protein
MSAPGIRAPCVPMNSIGTDARSLRPDVRYVHLRSLHPDGVRQSRCFGSGPFSTPFVGTLSRDPASLKAPAGGEGSVSPAPPLFAWPGHPPHLARAFTSTRKYLKANLPSLLFCQKLAKSERTTTLFLSRLEKIKSLTTNGLHDFYSSSVPGRIEFGASPARSAVLRVAASVGRTTGPPPATAYAFSGAPTSGPKPPLSGVRWPRTRRTRHRARVSSRDLLSVAAVASCRQTFCLWRVVSRESRRYVAGTGPRSSRTFWARPRRVKGFCRRTTPRSRMPRSMIVSSV